jgi:ABC-2 type transport system ATP-binding protein
VQWLLQVLPVPVIKVEDVSKVFRIAEKQPGVAGTLKSLVRPKRRDKVAVDGISVAVDAGEVIGYIGVNGTGKSTTIKMPTGILVPSSGRIRVGWCPFILPRPFPDMTSD